MVAGLSTQARSIETGGLGESPAPFSSSHAEGRRRFRGAWTRVRVALAPLVVLTAVLGWRFVQIEGLVLPPWVDSVHHTLAVRLLLEQGTLPATWGPYLPSVPFYYHFGFHLTAALFARLTGMTGLELGRAVLYVGQLWQVALAVAVYLLARRILRSREQALAATLFIGFASPMPAFYLSWGRYTLLAGIALLAFGMAAAARERWLAVGLLVAAVGVTHYYAFCLLLLFLGMLFVLTPGRARRLRLAAFTTGGVLLTAPWLLHVFTWNRAMTRVQAPMTDSAPFHAAPLAGLLGPTRNYVLLALAAAGLLSLVYRRRSGPMTHPRAAMLAFAGWATALAALTGPWQIGPFRPDHAAIVLFLPAALLASAVLWHVLPRAVAWAVVAALCIWGAGESRHVVRPDTVLARSADIEALRWIESWTAADATLMVDVAPWMGLWRGTDGGWWATPLTGRRTVPPPVAYSWGPPELAALVRQVGRRIEELPRLPDPYYCAGIERLMEETGADYYYTHTARAADCPNVEVMYRGRDGIRIVALSLR